MKKLMFAMLLFPTLAMAQSAIDGTWKIDLTKLQMSDKPEIFAIHDGKYDCKSCVPPVSIAADGADHKVTGQPYYDMLAVKVVDDRTIRETQKKDGRVVSDSTMRALPDGKTLAFDFNLKRDANTPPVTGKGTMTRVAAGPAESHAVSGSWRPATYDSISDNALTFTFKLDGDSVSMTSPAGQSYTAKLDGTDAPYKGDPGITSVSVKKIGANVVQETAKLNGKIVAVTKMTVAPDGKTMAISMRDEVHGRTDGMVAIKQ